jgi:hypothetical protein
MKTLRHFSLIAGNRNERLRKTLIHMGPAVLNGGFSTFLSIVLLCNSNSHVFITFFKVKMLYGGKAWQPSEKIRDRKKDIAKERYRKREKCIHKDLWRH